MCKDTIFKVQFCINRIKITKFVKENGGLLVQVKGIGKKQEVYY